MIINAYLFANVPSRDPRTVPPHVWCFFTCLNHHVSLSDHLLIVTPADLCSLRSPMFLASSPILSILIASSSICLLVRSWWISLWITGNFITLWITTVSCIEQAGLVEAKSRGKHGFHMFSPWNIEVVNVPIIQFRDILFHWEPCGQNNHRPAIWEWFIASIYGDDWGMVYHFNHIISNISINGCVSALGMPSAAFKSGCGTPGFSSSHISWLFRCI